MPTTRTSTDSRFKRPYRLRRQCNAARKAGATSLSKLLRLTAVVVVLLVVTLVVVFRTEREGQPTASTLAPEGPHQSPRVGAGLPQP